MWHQTTEFKQLLAPIDVLQQFDNSEHYQVNPNCTKNVQLHEVESVLRYE